MVGEFDVALTEDVGRITVVVTVEVGIMVVRVLVGVLRVETNAVVVTVVVGVTVVEVVVVGIVGGVEIPVEGGFVSSDMDIVTEKEGEDEGGDNEKSGPKGKDVMVGDEEKDIGVVELKMAA